VVIRYSSILIGGAGESSSDDRTVVGASSARRAGVAPSCKAESFIRERQY
jgi:hypothetical protein